MTDQSRLDERGEAVIAELESLRERVGNWSTMADPGLLMRTLNREIDERVARHRPPTLEDKILGERIELPPEPSHDRVIEARTPEGGMLVAWQDHDGLLWRAFAGSRGRRPEDWANIVEGALRLNWELFSCTRESA